MDLLILRSRFWLGFTVFWREEKFAQNGDSGSAFLPRRRFHLHRCSYRFGRSSHLQAPSQLHRAHLSALHRSDYFHGPGQSLTSSIHLLDFFLSLTCPKNVSLICFNFHLQVYALMSFLSLVIPESSIYFNSIREV